MKTISWKLKLTSPKILRCGSTRNFKNKLTNYTKSEILTKRLMLLPVDWDRNGLLFTMRLNMMNKIIG